MDRTNKNFFGTDGIRGKANSYPMTADIAMKLGMSAGKLFFRQSLHRNRVLIGKDTRLSGYMLEPALTSGFISVGMDVILVGPMPTPAVAMLTKSLRADIGLMLSASHNSYQDNGIKLFGPDGYKISDQSEKAIEAGIVNGVELVSPSNLGRARRLEDENGRYVEHLKATYSNQKTLEGLKIVIDCANGAAYRAAPSLFMELGAEVVPINILPDGFNINENCGSTSPEAMCSAVKENNADIGIALDGDADRLVIADERGDLIHGDQLIAMLAHRWRDLDKLSGKGIVTTIMSNYGLEQYLSSIGLDLHRVKVGDRHVLEYMRRNGFNFGGEQSGHIIFSDFSTTGDGLLAALQIMEIIIDKEKPLSSICKNFVPLPQILKNVEIGERFKLDDPIVKKSIKDAEMKIGQKGRLVVRLSGTEPLLRIMAESENLDLIKDVVEEVISVIKSSNNQ
tara:strand:+ start:220 stop:1575 length:1356 start_codon:yes stop_codon:yes gene_type:complete